MRVCSCVMRALVGCVGVRVRQGVVSREVKEEVDVTRLLLLPLLLLYLLFLLYE